MNKTKFAVFDIDGTIFRSSLVIQLSHALVTHGIFPKSATQEIKKEYLAWLDRKGTYEAYIDQVVKIYVKHIKGKDFKKVNRVALEVIAVQKDRTYRFTRDLIKKLKNENYFLIAISGSPSYIVEAYAKASGFNLFFGTVLEVKNGKFTGEVKNLDSAKNKDGIIKHLLETYSNLKIKNSVAIGDTEGDIKMLGLVEKPIAFNPNKLLLKVAEKNKWEVVVERKDVIFKIKNFNSIDYEI